LTSPALADAFGIDELRLNIVFVSLADIVNHIPVMFTLDRLSPSPASPWCFPSTDPKVNETALWSPEKVPG